MTKTNRRQVYKYIYKICKEHGCFVYRINGVSDHLHIALSIPPKVAPSRLIKEIKQYSSVMIKQKGLFEEWPGWQIGYFLASYPASARKNLVSYVRNQEVHHGETGSESTMRHSYRQELIGLLNEHGIDWDEKYLD